MSEIKEEPLKRILLVCAVFVFVTTLNAVDIPYSCTGSVVCDNGCLVDCFVSGTIDGPTTCDTQADPNSGIICQVWQGNTLIAETETSCNCGGGGGSGGTGDTCDVTQPLWWIFCNPWPM